MTQEVREKSQVVQCVLTVILGPIGLFYGSPALALVLCLAALLLALGTGGFGALLVWPISIGAGFYAINRGNRRLMIPGPVPEPTGSRRWLWL